MKTRILCGALLLLCACNKTTDLSFLAQKFRQLDSGPNTYVIRKGEHYTDQNPYQPVAVQELRFQVRFDSSAVYQTRLAENQYDINKLYGFSDNNSEHHLYSARFGWRWNHGALRLFAYVYNAGELTTRELISLPIGTTLDCSIKIDGDQYVFYYGDNWVSMPRTSPTAMGEGYLLYPYFGGDETAPQDIFIHIKNR